MSTFIASSNFTKMLANLFIFIVLSCAVFIAVINTLNRQPIPDYITTLLGAGIGSALNLLGVHQGTSLFLQNGATAASKATTAQ